MKVSSRGLKSDSCISVPECGSCMVTSGLVATSGGET